MDRLCFYSILPKCGYNVMFVRDCYLQVISSVSHFHAVVFVNNLILVSVRIKKSSSCGS